MSELADLLKDPRQVRVDNMLTHYDEAQSTLSTGQLGDGDGPIRMPRVWSRSGYPLLEQMLKALRVGAVDVVNGSALYGHVRAFYFQAERVRRPVVRKDKRGREFHLEMHGQKQYRLEVIRPAHSEKRVIEALAWIATTWPQKARYQPETLEEIVKRLERESIAA